ncbi:MAG TPA: hypothetical protein VM240_12590 [Verrucomicrobiae bacterium]|nr:hypothetical protein [Verrucomicrobiae bacterium]
MNLEMIAGRLIQLVGKVFEFWGRIIGNEMQRQHGYQMVCVGQMRVLGGQAAELLRYCTPRQALQVAPIPKGRR